MRTSSFTSRSSFGTLAALGGATAISMLFAWNVKTTWDGEGAYWSAAMEKSRCFAERFPESRAGNVVIYGGSTIRTSYMPSVLESEFSLSVVNCGLAAGFGPDVLTETAFEETKPEDLLVVALEPVFLVDDEHSETTSAGKDFYLREKGLSFRKKTFFSVSVFDFPGCVRVDTRYFLFLLARRIGRMKPYRYDIAENLHDDGWMELHEPEIAAAAETGPVVLLSLSDSGRDLLLRIRDACAKRGCRVCYQLAPQFHGNPNARLGYAALCKDISSIMPVIRDPMLGVNTNRLEFADTPHHPLRAGALRATRSFGEALARAEFWSDEELSALLDDGMRSGKLLVGRQPVAP